jgi:hyperosmotically inducible periplasmic protein
VRYKLATLLVIASMSFPVATFAADSDKDRANPGDFVKDSAITTKIKTKLASEHPGSMMHIKVDTDKNGVVWMTGTVNNQAEADRAVAIARGTEGVKSVNSDLKVQKDK